MAYSVLQKCTLHSGLVQPTFNDLSLTVDVLETLLGEAYTRLYRDDTGKQRQVPGGRIAKRAQGFLFIALQELSSKIAALNENYQKSIEQIAGDAFTAIVDGNQPRCQPY